MTAYDDIYEVAADCHGIITSVQTREMGISDKEMSRLAKDGRLTRVGRGVYRIKHHIPEENDTYAECVALVGDNAYLYGESVIAMFNLAPTNPTRVYVATPKRVRRKLPSTIHVVKRDDHDDVVVYDAIRAQSIPAAIMACKKTMMPERLLEAVKKARAEGRILAHEEEKLVQELEQL